MLEFRKSTRKGKKYMVYYNGKWIHFGSIFYEHFFDKTPINLYSNLNHLDKDRRKNYLSRAKGIVDGSGNLTWKDKNSANYYSIKYLW
jgi:hypothetical protein